MKFKLFFPLLITLLSSFYGISQISSSQPPKIVQPSPNVSAMQRYGDIPVSPYTGVPNISIPLYELKSGDISFSVSISYHASGIKVADEASRIGLGWSLNAGGVISRTIVGEDDFLQTTYGYHSSSTYVPEIASGDKRDRGGPFNIQGCSISIGSGNFGTYLGQDYNFQPDVYSYNFLGYSGKFILKRNKEVILAKTEKISIRCLDENANTWEIKTPDGMKYLFEESENYVGNGNTTSGPIGTHKTAWYLTKILSPKGSTVTFQYHTEFNHSIHPVGSYFESKSPVSIKSTIDQIGQATSPANVSQQTPGKDYKNIYLEKIIFHNGEIQFVNITGREDIENDVKVSKIQIYSKPTADASMLIKQWMFAYGYFEGTGDNDYNGGTLEHSSKRLKLISIQEQDPLGNSFPPYVFSYKNESTTNTALMPAKTSFARDHWGYYNGKSSNRSLIPSYTSNLSTNIIAHYLGVMGESRDSEPSFAQLFILNEIKYPTGGRTVFEYESHDYDLVNSNINDKSFFADYKETLEKEIRKFYLGKIDVEQPISTAISDYILDMSDMKVDRNGYASEVSLEAFFRYDGSARSYCLPSSSVYVTLVRENGTTVSGPTDISSLIGNTSLPTTICAGNGSNGIYYGVTFKNIYRIPPGKYIWKVRISNASSSLSFIQDVSLRVNYTAQKEKHSIVNGGEILSAADFAGGLRIRRIIDYDNVDDTKPKIKRYDYHYTDENGKLHSSGRRMARPIYNYFSQNRYVATEPITGITEFINVHNLVLESDSNIPLNGSINGTIVGYDQVNVYNGEQGEFGKTTYHFENSPDIVLDYSEYDYAGGYVSRIPRKPPVLGTMPNEGNGNITKQAEYKYEGGSFIPVKEIINTYNEFASATNSAWYGIEKRIIATDNFNLSCSFKSFLYPSIVESRKLLTSTVTRIYDQENSSLSLSTTTDYKYNNSTHLQLESSTTTLNNGDKKITTFTYPLDYSADADAVLTEMKSDRFMHASVITESRTLQKNNVSKLLDGIVNKYQIKNNNVVVKEVAKLETAMPVSTSAIGTYQPSSGIYPTGYNTKLVFNDYDSKANPLQITGQDGVVKSYIWGYNDTYPVAEITGASYNDLMATPGINHAVFQNPASDEDLRQELQKIRQAHPAALITTYTYKPLVGMTSQTDARNQTVYYEYDDFRRLNHIRDRENRILKKFQYSYSNSTITSPFTCNSLIGLLNDYRQVQAGALNHIANVTGGLHFTDTRDFYRDGVAKLPERFRTQPADFYAAFNLNLSDPFINTDPLKLCFMQDGYAVEWRLKMPANSYNNSFRSFDQYIYYVSVNYNFSAIFTDLYNSGPSNGTYLFGYHDFDGRSGGQHNGGNLFTHLQANPGNSLAHLFNEFHDVKLQVTPTDYYVYFDNVLVVTYPRNSTDPIDNRLYLTAAFLGNDGSIDHIKIFDNQGTLQFMEDFSNPTEPAKPALNLLCPPPADCRAVFTTYFNQRMGTTYTFNEISSFYQQTCGQAVNVCN